MCLSNEVKTIYLLKYWNQRIIWMKIYFSWKCEKQRMIIAWDKTKRWKKIEEIIDCKNSKESKIQKSVESELKLKILKKYILDQRIVSQWNKLMVSLTQFSVIFPATFSENYLRFRVRKNVSMKTRIFLPLKKKRRASLASFTE